MNDECKHDFVGTEQEPARQCNKCGLGILQDAENRMAVGR